MSSHVAIMLSAGWHDLDVVMMEMQYFFSIRWQLCYCCFMPTDGLPTQARWRWPQLDLHGRANDARSDMMHTGTGQARKGSAG